MILFRVEVMLKGNARNELGEILGQLMLDLAAAKTLTDWESDLVGPEGSRGLAQILHVEQ